MTKRTIKQSATPAKAEKPKLEAKTAKPKRVMRLRPLPRKKLIAAIKAKNLKRVSKPVFRPKLVVRKTIHSDAVGVTVKQVEPQPVEQAKPAGYVPSSKKAARLYQQTMSVADHVLAPFEIAAAARWIESKHGYQHSSDYLEWLNRQRQQAYQIASVQKASGGQLLDNVAK